MTGPPPSDRVGLGWRGELSAGILQHLDAIDVLEVIAEDGWLASRRQAEVLAELSRLRPLLLHGVTLGLASASPVAGWRLDRLARLVDRVRPEAWSEHLAFVRAGGVEIGHLAAPPRCSATVDGAAANIERAARVVGSRPMMENVATLIDPPGSTLDEPAWLQQVLAATGAGLLLDLHNLHANALNFGHDPLALLQRLPLQRVALVHVAGGGWIEHAGVAPRWLDDHVHAVPEPVYGLLQALAAAVPQPLTVVLERDGRYPAFSELLAELRRVRDALARGRAQRAAAWRAAA